MSGHRLLVNWSDDATVALEDIYNYGTENWSEALAERYLYRIRDVVQMISHNPVVGIARDDLREGLRSFPVEQHVVFYRVSTTDLTVVAIVHARADISGTFIQPEKY